MRASLRQQAGNITDIVLTIRIDLQSVLVARLLRRPETMQYCAPLALVAGQMQRRYPSILLGQGIDLYPGGRFTSIIDDETMQTECIQFLQNPWQAGTMVVAGNDNAALQRIDTSLVRRSVPHNRIIHDASCTRNRTRPRLMG